MESKELNESEKSFDSTERHRSRSRSPDLKLRRRSLRQRSKLRSNRSSSQESRNHIRPSYRKSREHHSYHSRKTPFYTNEFFPSFYHFSRKHHFPMTHPFFCDSLNKAYSFNPRSRFIHNRYNHFSENRKLHHKNNNTTNIKKEEAPENNVIGIFNLCEKTNERRLKSILEKFEELEEVKLIMDSQTGLSRGFAFVYFTSVSAAKIAKEELNGIWLDGNQLRVDYSLTNKPHEPSPGVYLGKNLKRNQIHHFKKYNKERSHFS